jgi:Rho-binding antiterminator
VVSESYRPISCVQHERLEFAVLRRLPLLLEYEEAGAVVQEKVMPLDVLTRDGAEWLTMRLPEGNVRELRLDRIRSFQENP